MSSFSPLVFLVPILSLSACKRGAAPDGMADGSGAAPAKISEHRAVTGLIDFTKFAAPAGTTRNEARPTSFSFSLPKTDPAIVGKSAAELEKGLAAQGWKPAPKAGATLRKDEGAMAYFQKQGAVISMSIGTSRGYQPGSQEVNAGLFLVGEADVRALPRFPGSSDTTPPSFDTRQLSVAAQLAEVRKFQSAEMVKLGWIEYRGPDLPGYEPKLEEIQREQAFLQLGTSVQFHYRSEGGKVVAIARSSVLERDLPIAPDAQQVQLDFSTPYLFYRSDLKSEEAFAFYEKALAPFGWKGAPAPPPKADHPSKFFRFEAAGQRALSLVCLGDRGGAFVELREAKN